MKIKEIHIRNSESHKRTILKLCGGVNAITGNSDVGKSGVVRSAYFFAMNKPRGDYFISHWSDKLSIKFVFDDFSITRIKGKQNIYKIGKEKIKIVGTDVPDRIRDMIGISENNFQFQGDRHFMISWSPGERASYLNEVTNLEVIGKANKNIRDQIKEEEREVKSSEDLIKQLKTEISEYDYLEEMEKDLSEIENIYEEISEIENTLESISEIISELIEVKEDIKKLSKTNTGEMKKEVESMLSESRSIVNLETKIAEIDSIIYEKQEIDEQQTETKKELKKLRERYESMMPDECPLCGNAIE